MIHECICSTVCGLGKGMVCFSTDNGENPKMGQGGLPHRKMCPSQVLFFSPSFVLSAYKLRCSDSPKESILWKIDGNGNTWAPLERTLVPDPSLDGNGSTWICSLRANFQHHQPLQKCSSQPPLPGFPLRHSVEIKISRKRQGHLEAPQVYAIALGLCGTPWDSVGLRGTPWDHCMTAPWVLPLLDRVHPTRSAGLSAEALQVHFIHQESKSLNNLNK